MGLVESDGVDSFNVLLSTGAIENVSVHDDQAGAYRRVTTLRQDLCADTETSAAMAFLAVAGLQTSLTTQFAAFVGWIRANGCGVGGDEDAAVLLAHLDDDQDLLWDLIDVSMEHGLLIESEDGIALSVALCDANPDDDADALIRSIYGGDYP